MTGRYRVLVEEVKKDSIKCRAVNSGILKNRKSVNIPGVMLAHEFYQ
jgi:pyruvate kinase